MQLPPPGQISLKEHLFHLQHKINLTVMKRGDKELRFCFDFRQKRSHLASKNICALVRHSPSFFITFEIWEFVSL